MSVSAMDDAKDRASSALASTDASDLPNLVARAMALFDAGDVVTAKLLASAAYDIAKVAAKVAGARHLIDKANRLQGDALLIECRAKMQLANDYDAAQEAGTLAKRGNKKGDKGKTSKVADDDLSSDDSSRPLSTLDDFGLTKQDVHEARKLRDKEAGAPGLVARAIAARLNQGLSPTRSLMRSLGNASASKEERGDDFYQTPIEAIQTLLCLERFSAKVWEPSVGHGAIARPLESAGYDVLPSDLVDRGFVSQDGVIQEAGDFLELNQHWIERSGFEGCDIVTNPPFGICNAYIYHALAEFRPRKMAMLLNLNVLCGADDDRRNFWMEQWPPARVHVFTRRLPMMHREGWEGNKSTSQMNVGWFVWERNADASAAQCQGGADVSLDSAACGRNEVYGTQTLLNRVDWKDYVGEAASGPREDGWRFVPDCEADLPDGFAGMLGKGDAGEVAA